MKTSVICVFVFFALPSALAINCYQCTPGAVSNSSSGDLCLNPSNSTTCSGSYDACIKATYEIKVGDTTHKMHSMSCVVKSQCTLTRDSKCDTAKSMQKANAANGTTVTLESCNADCCESNNCNGADDDGGSAGTSIVASAIFTFACVFALFSGF